MNHSMLTRMAACRIATWRNGNTNIELYSDGSKAREWPDGVEASPEFPESIDLKITDYCDAGCKWCHEMSTKRGLHAEFEDISNILSSLPRGAEVAIGGGNPLDHPRLAEILGKANEMGLHPSLTVNARHLESHQRKLFETMGLIRGLGVSYWAPALEAIKRINEKHDHIVVHLILGIDRPSDLLILVQAGITRFLLLGWKDYGRGKNWKNKNRLNDKQQEHWKEMIQFILDSNEVIRLAFPQTPPIRIGFDNNAVEQLNRLDGLVSRKGFDSMYMGDDGTFTMYIDAVKMEYAISSTKPRHPFHAAVDRIVMREAFEKVREMARGTTFSLATLDESIDVLLP